MSEEDMQEAAAHASRAARQARDAATEASEVAQNGAGHVAGEVTEKRVGKRINFRGLSAISGDTGTGFLALSVALYAGTIAFNKFSAAYKGRGRAVTP